MSTLRIKTLVPHKQSDAPTAAVHSTNPPTKTSLDEQISKAVIQFHKDLTTADAEQDKKGLNLLRCPYSRTKYPSEPLSTEEDSSARSSFHFCLSLVSFLKSCASPPPQLIQAFSSPDNDTTISERQKAAKQKAAEAAKKRRGRQKGRVERICRTRQTTSFFSFPEAFSRLCAARNGISYSSFPSPFAQHLPI